MYTCFSPDSPENAILKFFSVCVPEYLFITVSLSFNYVCVPILSICRTYIQPLSDLSHTVCPL